jgi:hypothetical protein
MMWYFLYACRFGALARSLDVGMMLTLYGAGFALLAYRSRVRPYCIFCAVGGGPACGPRRAAHQHGYRCGRLARVRQ